jgi:sugar (pentulose or hexulose) kinase
VSLRLGIDVGTSPMKEVLADERGRVIGVAQRTHETAMPERETAAAGLEAAHG